MNVTRGTVGQSPNPPRLWSAQMLFRGSVWDGIDQDHINKMIKGLKGRAEDVVASQGRFREGQKLNRGAFTKS